MQIYIVPSFMFFMKQYCKENEATYWIELFVRMIVYWVLINHYDTNNVGMDVHRLQTYSSKNKACHFRILVNFYYMEKTKLYHLTSLSSILNKLKGIAFW